MVPSFQAVIRREEGQGQTVLDRELIEGKYCMVLPEASPALCARGHHGASPVLIR